MGAFAVTPVPGVSESSDTRTLVALALGVAVVALVVVGAGVSGHLIENRLRTSSENQLRHVALHDALTGLANRRYFAEALDARCAAMQAGGPGLALILVDLDRFKAVNDTYGHLVGDVVLHRAAERLAAAVAHAGELARVGGDEFAILLLGEAADRAESIADRIVQLLGSPFLVEGNMAEIGASVGLARGPHDGITASELTHNADLALYAAKAAGRDGFRAFDAIMAEQVEQRRALETDLRWAVAREEFEVFYQPQVASRTGTFVGAEALIRWRHPTRCAIPPSTFIPIAEELGLVSQIGKFVLRRACEDARNWPSHLSVAVNISPMQLLDPCLSQMVAGVLHETGLDPARLEIEITETALLGNDEVALATLRALAALGIRVSLDDFGTGYSSLSYLHGFPINSIKIDRSFVQHLPDDAGSASIVRAIAQLGQSLGLSITVEGVETAEQRDWAAKQGCDNLQGYLFSRPVPAQDLAAIWHANAGQTAA